MFFEHGVDNAVQQVEKIDAMRETQHLNLSKRSKLNNSNVQQYIVFVDDIIT